MRSRSSRFGRTALHQAASGNEPALVTLLLDRSNNGLLNLVDNGLRYVPEGGSVTLRMESMSSGPLRITVQDDGPGLSPEQAAHLFEPFNRLGQEHGSEAGTGIGLVITQRIVGLMGGTLQAACLEGQGCAFWFELPTEAQDQTDLATSRPSSQHATPDRTSS